MQAVAIGLAVTVGLVIGIPLAIFALRENNDVKDENETCKPIIDKYQKSHNAKALIADYETWTKGKHSSYSRVHFGGDVVAEL